MPSFGTPVQHRQNLEQIEDVDLSKYTIFPVNLEGKLVVLTKVDRLGQTSDRDVELIRLLQANARESISNLARMLGVSRTAVQERLNRLKRIGVIEGFTVKLNPDWNRNQITTFIELVVDPKYTKQIMATLERIPSIRALWSVSGRFDFLAEATAPTTEDINNLLDDVGNIEGVIRTESAVVLSTKIERG